MGCNQSKAVQVSSPGKAQASTAPTSPVSTASLRSVTLPRELNKIPDPGYRLFVLLQMTLSRDEEDELIWAKIIKICDKTPTAAIYQHQETGDTPLHLACRILTAFPFQGGEGIVSPLDAMRVLVRCSAEIASCTNQNGNLALHDMIRPSVSSPEALQYQTQIINLLITSDYESSVEYLSRTNVTYDPRDGACTPLYHAVASMPDDFNAPPGPTVKLISAIHFPCPTMVAAKNDANYDKPLALLYRRFSRQFDLSEKFFPGDNSRREVLDHRQRYKTAAMNTWKIILALLDPLLDKKKSVSDFYMVHAAVRMDCPPDLLRYIIETRPEEVRQTNERGRLPLHVAAGSKSSTESSAASRYHYKFVIDELLYSYPDGAASTDADNMLPLQLAVNSGKTWIGGGTKSL